MISIVILTSYYLHLCIVAYMIPYRVNTTHFEALTRIASYIYIATARYTAPQIKDPPYEARALIDKRPALAETEQQKSGVAYM